MTTVSNDAVESQVLPTDILSSKGVPFETKGAAGMCKANKNLGDSHKVVAVVGGGFVVRELTLSEKTDAVKAGGDDEKVYWVTIRHASGNVQTNARLCMPGVNGEMLWLKRGRRYPLPARFLTSLDATQHPTSKYVLGQDRSDTLWVQDDDYDIEREATWEDYKKWAAETDHGRND